MDGRTRRLSFLVVLFVLVVALGLKWLELPQQAAGPESLEPAPALAPVDIRAYLPPWLDASYEFSGEGIEYASFTRRITHTSPGFIQMEDASGTNLAQVVEINAEEAKIIWAEEEFYEKRNLLYPFSREARTGDQVRDVVLLKAPAAVGTVWSDERFQREIVSVDQVLTVPFGTFYDVLVVKSRSHANDSFVHYEYYAINVGLIKREALYMQDGEAFTVISELENLTITPTQN